MPRMKADSKGSRHLKCRRWQVWTRHPRGGIGALLFAAVLCWHPLIHFDGTPLIPRAYVLFTLTAALTFGGPSLGMADMTYAHENAVETVTAGFFCLARPDAAGQGLGGSGKVNLYLTPPPFVAEGDQVPSLAGIGIGVVARLSPFLRDAVLIARASHGEPCCNKAQSWMTRSRPDGLIWLGHLEGGGAEFPPGLWRFSLWRGPLEVFSYEINVLPHDPKAQQACAAPTS